MTGFTVGAGARGGPLVEYGKVARLVCAVEVGIVGGGAGWRAIKAGIRSARRRSASGRTVSMYGSRQTKV